MPPPRHILNDGEDLPDKFVLKSPLPTSITLKPSANATTTTQVPSTLFVVAPKLSFLFDKLDSAVTQVASIEITFEPETTQNAIDEDFDEEDQTKRYFDYDAPDAPPGSDVATKVKSLLEIPIFRTTVNAVFIRLPVVAPSVSHGLATGIVNLLVKGSDAGPISNVVVLAPAEMSADEVSIAILSTSSSKLVFDLPTLNPPYCVQGAPASVLTACETSGISATCLAVRAEGPVGHEMVNPYALSDLASILNGKFEFKLSTKNLSQGSGMYI